MRIKKYTMPYTPTYVSVDNLINRFSVYVYLQNIRVMQHKSQEEMSIISGLSVGTISRIETGQNVTVDNLIKYAQSLGYEINVVKKSDHSTIGESK